MTQYLAQMIHGRTGGEANHPFDGPPELMDRAPDAVMRHFMGHVVVAGHTLHEHDDYEIHSARKNESKDCVTVMGDFIYSDGGRSPFVCMISHATGGARAQNTA